MLCQIGLDIVIADAGLGNNPVCGNRDLGGLTEYRGIIMHMKYLYSQIQINEYLQYAFFFFIWVAVKQVYRPVASQVGNISAQFIPQNC